MNHKPVKSFSTIFYTLIACIVLAHAAVHAQEPTNNDTTSTSMKQQVTADLHVSDAVAVVRKIEGVERMRDVLKSAKGIFIVPSYGRAALGVGAAGGTGVLLVRHTDGNWSDPVFYNAGSLSVGLQAGAESGNLVLVLNNDKAVSEFFKKNNFSVNAKAGLTVVSWNKMVQGSAGMGDVVAWSDNKGLFGDIATVEVNDIRFSQQMTNAYYNQSLSATDVINGTINNRKAAKLVQALVAAAGPAH